MSSWTLFNTTVMVLLFSSLQISYSENNLSKFGIILDRQEDSLSKCVVTIAIKTFYRNTLTMIYEEGSFNKNRHTIHRALFSIGIAIQHVLSTHLTDNQMDLCVIAYGGNFLLAIRNHTLIESIFRKFRDCDSWSSERKVISLVPLYGAGDRLSRIPLINTVMNLQLVNSIALIENDHVEDRYDITSGYAYSRGVCERSNHSDVVTLDSCLHGVLDNGNVELFPKVAQLNGCPLRIGIVPYEPYIQTRKEGEGENATDLIVGGLEVLFVNTMASIMNFSAVYVMDKDKQNWGDVYANGTMTGLFKMLMDSRADLVMSSLSATVERNKRFNGIYPFFFTTQSYCVHYADKLPDWQKMINVFHWTVIIIISILMIIMAFLSRRLFNISLIAEKFKRCNNKNDERNAIYKSDISYYKDPLLIWQLLIATALTTSVHRFPRNGRVRALFTLWFLLSINIDTGFRTRFMTLLSRDDHNPQLQNYEEMIERNYTVYLVEHEFNYYKEVEHPGLNQLWHQCHNLTWCLDQVAYGHNTALRISTVTIASIMNRYVPPGYTHPIIYCLPNITITLPMQIFSMRGFTLRQSFNEAIHMLSSGGFFEQWKRMSIPVLQMKLSEGVPSRHEDVRLTFGHLQAMFVLISIFYALATALFFLELWHFKYYNQKL